MPVRLFFIEISTLQTMTRLIIYRPSPVRMMSTVFLSADILTGEGLRLYKHLDLFKDPFFFKLMEAHIFFER